MTTPRAAVRVGLRSTLVVVLVTAGLTSLPAGPALAIDVSTEAALRAAVSDPAQTSIVVTADITLTNCAAGDLDRNSATDLVITGADAGHTITQTCPHRILRQVGVGALTLERLTLTGGAVTGGSGGAVLTAGAITLVDSTVSGNSAEGADGAAGGDAVGGIDATGDVTLTGSTIVENAGVGGDGSSDDGGAGIGAIRSGAVVTLTDSVVRANVGTGGDATSSGGPDGGDGIGGISAPANAGSVAITETTIADNVGSGGTSVTTVSGIGSAGDGVGALLYRGPVAVTGSVISGNHGTGGNATNPDGIVSGGWGVGGIVNVGSGDDVAISDTTFAGNVGTGGNGHAISGLGSGGLGAGGLVAYFRHSSVASSRFLDNEGTGGRGSSSGGNGCCPGGGSGIGAYYGETIEITTSQFSGNTGTGGEDANTGGTGNTGGRGVGAIFQPYTALYGSLSVTASTINGNEGTGGPSSLTAGSGIGGIYTPGPVVALNVTVTGNIGTGGGAGAGTGIGGLVGNAVDLVYTTVVTNKGATAANVQGAPTFDDDPVFRAFGTVIAMPITGPNCNALGTMTSSGHNLDDDGTCGLGAGTGDLSNSAAALSLGTIADNGGPTSTRLPGDGSALIDAIPLSACSDGDTLAGVTVDVDQRGEPRPGADACDIGAVEVQPAPPEEPEAPEVPPIEAEVTRIAGADRMATAAAIAAARFTTADTVFLATALNFPDALAGGPLAARMHAPILLSGTEVLAEAARAELERLGPATLVILGGTAAVPEAIADAAAAAAGGATVDRIAGPDRYATAAAIAARYPTATRAYLATGENFPDALTGGALAAARDDGPVVLTRRAELPTMTATELERLAPDEVVVLGGTAAVPAGVADAAAGAAGGATVTRLGGADRFETAALIGAEFTAPTEAVYVATGLNFPDALAGTPAAAQTASPILLTARDELHPATIAQLERLDPIGIVILGGTAVVSDAVATALETYLR